MAVYPPRGITPWDDDLKAYLDERESEIVGGVAQIVEGAVEAHKEDDTPHPVYDEMPSLVDLFENGLM